MQQTSHRDAKKEECRRAIVQAALALFEARGFEGTTIEEIAREAGVSRPTVFNYFARKEDLLPAAMVALMRDRLKSAFPGGREASLGDPVPSLRKILVSNAAVFQEYPQTGRAFHSLKMQQAALHFRTPGEGLPDPEPPLADFLSWIDVLIERAQERGEIRTDYDRSELRFHLMIGLFSSTIGPWMHGCYGDRDLSEIVDSHFGLYVEGMRA